MDRPKRARLQRLTFNRLAILAAADFLGHPVTLGQLAVACGISRTAIQREVKTAVALGYLEAEALRGPRGRGGAPRYRLRTTEAGHAARAEYLRTLFGAMPAEWSMRA